MRSFVLQSLAALGWLTASSCAEPGKESKTLTSHDETFVPDHVLHITGQNISQACVNRYSAVVNGSSPGPEIRLKAGEAAWIRVYNDMEDSNVTMHWHGLAQRMAEFSDGSPLASQWPIAAGTFFDYEIQVPAKEAGTYFYHSHIGMQALTVTGALIVEDCGPPPYEYDEDKVLLFHEHYATEDHKFEEGLLAAPLVFGGEVQSLMLNGAGPAVNHTAGELGADDKSCNLAVIDVEPGKTYRFRFIGATSLAHSSMAFEGHEEMKVIAVDGGQYTQPAPIDRMQIGSGQRFDVLFTAKTSAELEADGRSDYYLQYETRDRPVVFRGYAILRYKSSAPAPLPVEAPAEPVLTLPDQTFDWLESVLQPLVPDPDFPTLAEVTRTVILDARQLTLNETGQIVWQFNGLNWNEVIAYQTPLLVDIYQRGEEAIPNYDVALANQGWDPETKAFPVKKGEVLEIVLQNTGSLVNNGGSVDVHPMHAHGDHYWDMGSGNGTYNATEWEAQRIARGYTPVKRDTTLLYRYTNKTLPGVDAGWRTWRIRADAVGVWMIHCHTLQHMVMGMQTVWVIGNASDIMTIPTDLSQEYLTFGGSVYGDEANPPKVYEQFNHNATTCPATHYDNMTVRGHREGRN